jgi:GNAT superfamily N-acetyltransferase
LPDIKIRPMTLRDIPLGMRLKSLAKWNQQELDWELLINAGKGGNFVATYNGTEAGTTTTLTYQERFSWIGMVLVDPAFRGLGIGTFLLKEAINFAKSLETVRLDATPQGKKLYETLGFKTERNLLRLETKFKINTPYVEKQGIPITEKVLPAIIEKDHAIFGANRNFILKHLVQYFPEYCYYNHNNGSITSYCLGRSGSNFEHIGPLIADDEEEALNILHSVLGNMQDKRVIIDVLEEKKQWLSLLLKELGFEVQRPFIRMYLGELKHPGIPAKQFAIAGPELG